MDDFIVATCQYNDEYQYITKEIGYLHNAKSVKIDLAGDMDFEIVADEYLTDNMGFLTMVYRPGTEWGGILTKRQVNTYTNEHTWTGWSARGLMKRFVIQPAAGQTHVTINGEANSVIRQLVAGSYSGAESPISIIGGSTEDSGIQISYSARYATLLESLENALANANARLCIEWKSAENAGEPSIIISAKPIVDYSADVELSQDMNEIAFTVEQMKYGTRRLICLGSGEGTSRLIVTLYLWSDGTIRQTPERPISASAPFSLFGETEVYDYPNAEDASTLVEYGRKRIEESMPYKTIKASVTEENDPNMAIGDIIGGRELVTGDLITEPITNKALVLSGGIEKVTYTTKGSDE